MRRQSDGLFPLTPALSLRERGNQRQSLDSSGCAIIVEALARILPAPELRLASNLPTIPPLPFRRGEGRGGSVLGLRFRGAIKGPTPAQPSCARDQFPDAEGLGHIVVGAQFQPANDIILLGLG